MDWRTGGGWAAAGGGEGMGGVVDVWLSMVIGEGWGGVVDWSGVIGWSCGGMISGRGKELGEGTGSTRESS